MPAFSIHIVNSNFVSTNSLDASSAETARSQALKGALQIGADEVSKGNPFFGAEIRIHNEDDEVIERLVASEHRRCNR